MHFLVSERLNWKCLTSANLIHICIITSLRIKDITIYCRSYLDLINRFDFFFLRLFHWYIINIRQNITSLRTAIDISGRRIFHYLFTRLAISCALVRNIIPYVSLFSVFVMLTFAPPRSFHAHFLRFQNKALWLQHIEEDLAYKIRRCSPGHFQTCAKSVILQKKRLHFIYTLNANITIIFLSIQILLRAR